MKSLWLLLHTAILSAISINPIQVSADQPATQSAVHAATAESEITRKQPIFNVLVVIPPTLSLTRLATCVTWLKLNMKHSEILTG